MAIETELFVADAYGAYADIAAASSRFSQDDVRLGFDTNELRRLLQPVNATRGALYMYTDDEKIMKFVQGLRKKNVDYKWFHILGPEFDRAEEQVENIRESIHRALIALFLRAIADDGGDVQSIRESLLGR